MCGVRVCVCEGERAAWAARQGCQATGCTDGPKCERMGSEELVVRWWWDRRFWAGEAFFPLPGSLAAQMQRPFNFWYFQKVIPSFCEIQARQETISPVISSPFHSPIREKHCVYRYIKIYF